MTKLTLVLRPILAIRVVLFGGWSQQEGFLQNVVKKLPDSSVRDRIEQLLPPSIPETDVAEMFGASGYVVDTVPLALYCAQNIASRSLESVLSSAIACGGDTDTIASIAGQVTGAFVGATAIDREQIARIEGSEEIVLIANRFANFVCRAG